MISATTFGSDSYKFEVLESQWPKLPPSISLYDVPGIAVDRHDRVYLFTRTNPPILVFDLEGNFLHSWGDGVFKVPHSVRIGPDGMVYCVDCGDHTIRKFTPEGELLQ